MSKIVCVAGMHRSGTSLVMNLLQRCGVYVGEQKDLMAGSEHNEQGFWENKKFVQINNAVLHRLGGAWTHPPSALAPSTDARLGDLGPKAMSLVAAFSRHDVWGWKDPRNSLTLPFWKSVAPSMKVVVCVRNPVEVARSFQDVFSYVFLNRAHWRSTHRFRGVLPNVKNDSWIMGDLVFAFSRNARNAFARAFCLDLWTIYNQRILETTQPEERVITCYARYFENSSRELQRLLDHLGISPPQEVVDLARAAPSSNLRHKVASVADLQSERLPRETLEVYEMLLEQARRD